MGTGLRVAVINYSLDDINTAEANQERFPPVWGGQPILLCKNHQYCDQYQQQTPENGFTGARFFLLTPARFHSYPPALFTLLPSVIKIVSIFFTVIAVIRIVFFIGHYEPPNQIY
jgi:hypothetical protein